MKKQLQGADAELKLAADAIKKGKGLGTARGVETLFRSAYRVQMELTSLADNKANMMTSINGIIISIIIASVAPKLDANPWLLIPSTVFLLGTLINLIDFSLLPAILFFTIIQCQSLITGGVRKWAEGMALYIIGMTTAFAYNDAQFHPLTSSRTNRNIDKTVHFDAKIHQGNIKDGNNMIWRQYRT